MAGPDGMPASTFSTDTLWRTFRERLVFDRESEPNAAESVQPKLVLTRHRQEGDTRPFLFDPQHLRQIALHGSGPVVRIHLERQVLPTVEGFRET